MLPFELINVLKLIGRGRKNKIRRLLARGYNSVLDVVQ